MTRLRFAASAAIVVAVAALSVVVTADLSPASYGVAQLSLEGPVPNCAQWRGEIAVLARLRTGHSASELGSHFAAVRSSEDGLYVIHGANTTADLRALSSNRAVLKAGYLMSHTSDPNYQSCNYRLTDNARAGALFISVEPAMVRSGLINMAQIEDPSTIRVVTDDPTKDSQLFVAAIIETPLTADSSGTLTAVVVTVERHSMQVLSVELGNWYG